MDKDIYKMTEKLRGELFGTPEKKSNGLQALRNKLASDDANRVDKVVNTGIPLTDAYTKLNDGTFVPKYDKYIPGEDNAEINALKQSTGEKWLNGVTKLGGKTLTAIAGGTLGQVVGITELIKTGNMASLYDNDMAKTLDDINVKMDNKLPNYYTKAERKMNLGESLLTANFLANDVLAGLSFTLGAIGTELIWGGLTGGASLATAGAKLSFMASMKSMAKSVAKNSYKDMPLAGITRAVNVGKGLSLANTARFAFTSAGYEAGVEAFQFTKEMREGFYQDFLSKNGVAPTSEDISKNEENLSMAANKLYGFNLAVVGSSNLVTVGRMFDMKTPKLLSKSSDWINKKAFGVGAESMTKFQKIARLTYTLGKSPVVEGIYEEGLQGTGSSAAEFWVKSKFDPKYSENSLSLGDAFYEGLSETYGTAQGWKEIGVGMLIGAISGSGVNLISGRGEFTEADKKVANQKAFDNSYSGKQFMHALGLANRTQALTESFEEAQEKGDLTGQEMARKGQVVNQLSYAYEMDSLSDTVAETLTSIEAVNVETLASEKGISIEEAQELKNKIKQEYKTTAESFKKYRDFSEAYIGDKLSKGESKYGTATEVKDAMAYQLTMGENTYNYSQEILDSLKLELSGFSDTLDLHNTLSSATQETRNKIEEVRQDILKQRENKTKIDNRRKALVKTKLGVNSENHNSNAQELNQITEELAELNEKEVSLNFKLNNLLKTANLENPFSNNTERVITNDQLLNLEEQLKELNTTTANLGKSDLQKSMRINALIEEYGRATNAFKQQADISRQLTTGDLQLFGGKLRRTFQGKEPNEITVEFLEGILGTIENSKVQRTVDYFMGSNAGQTLSNAEVLEKEEVEQIPSEPTLIEKFLNNNPYLRSIKEGVKKPTEQDVERFQMLSTKALYDENVDVNDEVDVIESDSITEEESIELEELRELIANWQMYDGMTEEGVSLAEVIEQTNQNNITPNTEIKQQAVTSKELNELADPDYVAKESQGKRPENISQTFQSVQVKRDISDNATVHNITLGGFLASVNLPIIDEDGYDVVPSALSNEPGTVVRVGGSSITINSKGVLEIVGFQEILDNSNYADYRYSYGKQSGYSFLYADGKLKESDYEVGDYNFEAIYDLVENEEVFLKVEADVEYNQNLSEEALEGQLIISIIDSKGNKIGVLKSNQDIYGKDENFNLIRKRAVEVFKNGGGLINVQVNAEYVFLGTPNFEMEDGAPKEQPLNPEDVVDWGYYDGKNFQLVNKTKNVRGSFISKIKKRVPVIIFKRGNQLVAFPVELKGQANPMGGNVSDILLHGESVAKSVIEVNNLLLANGRGGDLYFLSPKDQNIYTETGEFTDTVKGHIEAMDQLQTFQDISKLEKEQLPDAVAIAINISSNPISSPKIVLKFGEPVATEVVKQAESEGEKTEKVLNKVAPKKKTPKPAPIEVIAEEVIVGEEVITVKPVEATSPTKARPAPVVEPITPQEALTKEAKIIKEQPKSVEAVQTEMYTDFTFKEGSTLEEFKDLVEEGDRVIGRDFYTATKGGLKSDKGGPIVEYPNNPAGWIISKPKIKKEISSVLKGRSKKQQNKNC